MWKNNIGPLCHIPDTRKDETKKANTRIHQIEELQEVKPVLFYNDWLPLKQTPTDLNLTIHERTEKMDKLIITNVVDKDAREKVMRIGNNKSQ